MWTCDSPFSNLIFHSPPLSYDPNFQIGGLQMDNYITHPLQIGQKYDGYVILTWKIYWGMMVFPVFCKEVSVEVLRLGLSPKSCSHFPTISYSF